MAGLVVAQFTAAAVGLAVALAVARGIAGRSRRIGNFWADFTRSLVRVFVPLSVIGALVLVSQGVVQNFSGLRTAGTLAGGTQQIPGGPVASMEVIKLLGTNGGSMYGAGGTLGLTMLIGRFAPIVLALAIGGSLAGARVHARTRATLDTAGLTFAGFLVGVIVIVGGLIYFPMLILGPVGERIVG
jgi:K+-transporting ATPase ATPase A chain